MKFTFIHAADLHLDTPFEGIGRTAPEIADLLREASLEAFDSLVKLACDRDAAFLLIAGDVNDGPERGVRAQIRLQKGIAKLAEKGISTFIALGNHDPEGGWSAIREWPARTHLFSSQNVASVPVVIDGKPVATVHGISFPRRDVEDNLSLLFKRTAAPGLHIGLLHCNAGANSDHSAYSPCSISDLENAGVDYWALGHIHKRIFLREGNPWIVYPGNIQGRSPKKSEQGEKGAVVVTAEDNKILSVEFVALDRIRFYELEIDVSDVSDIAALSRLIAAQAENARDENTGRAILVRAVLTGQGAIHRDISKAGVIEGLLDELRKDFSDLSPFLWFENIAVRTRPDIDMAALRGGAGFSSELLRFSDSLRSDKERFSSFISKNSETLIKGKSFKNLIPALDPVEGCDAAEIFDAAVNLSLNLLEDKEGN